MTRDSDGKPKRLRNPDRPDSHDLMRWRTSTPLGTTITFCALTPVRSISILRAASETAITRSSSRAVQRLIFSRRGLPRLMFRRAETTMGTPVIRAMRRLANTAWKSQAWTIAGRASWMKSVEAEQPADSPRAGELQIDDGHVERPDFLGERRVPVFQTNHEGVEPIAVDPREECPKRHLRPTGGEVGDDVKNANTPARGARRRYSAVARVTRRVGSRFHLRWAPGLSLRPR